jgi:hypothetical protein
VRAAPELARSGQRAQRDREAPWRVSAIEKDASSPLNIVTEVVAMKNGVELDAPVRLADGKTRHQAPLLDFETTAGCER